MAMKIIMHCSSPNKRRKGNELFCIEKRKRSQIKKQVMTALLTIALATFVNNRPQLVENPTLIDYHIVASSLHKWMKPQQILIKISPFLLQNRGC